MTNRPSNPIHRWLPALLMVLILLAGCSSPQTPTVDTPPPADPETSNPTATATEASTELPPLRQAKVLLIADPASSDSMQAAQTEILRGFSEQNGLEFEVRPALETSGLSEEIRMVIYLKPAGDISPLLADAPERQFVVVGGEESQAGANLSVIVVDDAQVAFLAGYIAEMISPDFRAAGLFPNERSGLAEAFQNGGRYLCGRCVPIYAPVVFFPLIGSVPEGSAPPAWISAFGEVHKNRIQTVFLARQAASPDVIANLAQQEITILSESTPPEELRSAVTAIIQVDVNGAIQTLLPELLDGHGGQMLRASLVLSDVDVNRITPGKLQQIQQIIDDLADGRIYPQSIPLE